jgi:DNA-binding transcriptional LysR family regulator
LYHEPLASPPLVVLLPEAHPLANRAEICLDELHAQPLIVPERTVNPELYDAIVTYFAARGVKPDFQPRHVRSPVQVRELVALQEGVAVTRTGCWQPIARTVEVPLGATDFPGMTAYLLWPKEVMDPLTPALLAVARDLRSAYHPWTVTGN